MSTATPEVVVIGGGILGLAVARDLRSRHPDASVLLLEKEEGVGRHQSGRNSGVLHAGFYYSADSLKAELTREGNRRLTGFCRDRGLPINECGKLVVAYRGLAGGAASGSGAPGVEVRTDAGVVSAGHVVNCAGLYADRVARDFGFSRRYRILPFKGLYLHSDEPAGACRTNIYPVPRIDRPFLGVHFTVDVRGRAKIGPTATPAFWREHYRGLANFDLGELWEVLRREASLLLRNDFGFRTLVAEELGKHRRSKMVELASNLARDVETGNFRRWGEPGVRAQLVDVEERELVMDFLLQGDGHSTHVLNAVSPGFTCALPFAEVVADRVEGETRGASVNETEGERGER